jgi:hypothetical protein
MFALWGLEATTITSKTTRSGTSDAFVADDHEWDSASDADTLDDDASTQRSQSFSDYENDDQRFDGARRPAWLD